jgi:hypothetical protein
MSTLRGEAIKTGATSVTPKIRVIFTKQLPIMFPRAIVGCPFKKALMQLENSGKLVPNAIIVALIKISGTLKNLAIVTADSTIKYELATTPKAPIKVSAVKRCSFLPA